MNRLLVVEDEPIVAVDLRQQLTRLGYEIVGIASSGEKAVELAGSLHPDLVLMDVHLQGMMDGVDAAAIMRRLQVPVIFLTAHADDATIGRASQTDPAGYVLKPFDDRTLRTVVQLTLEKNRATRRLRETEQRYHHILSSIGEGVITTDPHHRITYLNPIAQRLSGWSEEDAVDRPLMQVAQLLSPESHEPLELPMPQSPGYSPTRVAVGYLKHRDGTLTPVEYCATLLTDEAGEVYGSVLDVRDISIRYEEERRRKQAEIHLQQLRKLQTLGSFVAGIAHDFNNLLATILGYAEVAQLESPDDPRLQSAAQEIIDASLRGAQLTRQMLCYAGKGGADFERIPLARIVHDVVSTFSTLRDQGITLHLELPPALPLVDADLVQLREALTHLIRNAIEAIEPSPGNIWLRAGSRQCDAAFLSKCYLGTEAGAGHYAFIQVEDSGSGIATEHLESIFDPFYTTKFAGRGLGLAAAVGIAHNHHGFLHVESRLGAGSTFTLLLPIAAIEHRESNQVDPPLGKLRGTVLLVDDDRSLRLMAKTMLATIGLTVEMAENGPMALDLLEEEGQSYDVYLVDVTMPFMDGPTLFRKIRARRPDAKVILFSGYGPDEIMDELYREGLVAFIQKPFTTSRLRVALAVALGSEGGTG